MDPVAYANWVKVRTKIQYVNGVVRGANLSSVDGWYLIQVDNESSQLTARFRIAHEVAHILLIECGLLPVAEDPASRVVLERACDQAAAEMLMPAQLLRSFVKHTEPSLAGLKDVSREFAVSYQAAAIELVRHGWNCAVMMVKSHWTPNRSTQLRLSWFAVPSRSGIELKRNEVLPPDCWLYRRLPNGIHSERAHLTLGAGLMRATHPNTQQLASGIWARSDQDRLRRRG